MIKDDSLTYKTDFFVRLFARISRLRANRQSVMMGMILVASYLVIGKLAGAAKEVAVAYRYGVGIEVDAYLNVVNLMLWPVATWLSVLSSVLVPLVAQIRHSASSEMPQFRAELLGFTLLLCPAAALVAWYVVPSLLQAPSFGLSPAIKALSSNITVPLLVLVPLGLVIDLFSVWLLATGRHVNTLLEGVPALVICIAVSSSLGSFFTDNPLVWGTVVGYWLHMFILWVCLVYDKNIEWPRFAFRSRYWATFWEGFGISVAGQMIMNLIIIVDQFFAAQLGAGTLATLSYANRVLALILGLGATAVSRATLPIFSAAAAEGRAPAIKMANHWARVLFVLGLLGLGISWWFAPTIVRLLFERGAFSASDTLAVAEIFRYGLLQVPVYFSGLVLVSFLWSNKQYKLIAIGSALNLVVKVVANYVLVPTMGSTGIILATSVMYAFSFGFLWFSSSLFVRRVSQ